MRHLDVRDDNVRTAGLQKVYGLCSIRNAAADETVKTGPVELFFQTVQYNLLIVHQ